MTLLYGSIFQGVQRACANQVVQNPEFLNASTGVSLQLRRCKVPVGQVKKEKTFTRTSKVAGASENKKCTGLQFKTKTVKLQFLKTKVKRPTDVETPSMVDK